MAISIGLLMLLRARAGGTRVSDVDGLIDMAVIGIVSLLGRLAGRGASHARRHAPWRSGVRRVWASYPILDAALLALVVRTFISRSSGVLLLVVGVGSWLFSDFFYMLFPTRLSWAVWLDAGWMVGAAMMAAATWSHTSRSARYRPDVETGRRRPTLRSHLRRCSSPGHRGGATAAGVDPDPVPMLVASCLLAGLVFVRALAPAPDAARREAELRAAEQQFRALVQRSSDAALVLEPDGRVRYVSPAAHDQFGYTVEALVGHVGWDLIHPDDLHAPSRRSAS